jgi:hypothetical protein
VFEPRDRGGRVGPHFALVDDRSLVGVEHLHRVLDGDDVALTLRIDVVDDRRQRGRLARTGEAGHEDQPVPLLGQRRHRGREAQRVEARDAGQHPAEDQADPAPLAERAHPEPPETGDAVHEVALVRLGERLGSAAWDHRGRDALGVFGLDGVERRFAEPPVDPEPGPRAHFHVHVGCAVFHGEAQQFVQVQHDASARCIGGSPGCL